MHENSEAAKLRWKSNGKTTTKWTTKVSLDVILIFNGRDPRENRRKNKLERVAKFYQYFAKSSQTLKSSHSSANKQQKHNWTTPYSMRNGWGRRSLVLQQSKDSYSSKANIYLKKAWQGLLHIMNDETQISLIYLRKKKVSNWNAVSHINWENICTR